MSMDLILLIVTVGGFLLAPFIKDMSIKPIPKGTELDHTKIISDISAKRVTKSELNKRLDNGYYAKKDK